MSWMKMAVEAVVLSSRPMAEWMRIFAENFGRQGNDFTKKADEAFYALMEAGEHMFIAEFVLQRPLALRSHLVTVFLTGEARLRKYPPAPKEVAELVRRPLVEAFTGVLLGVSKKYENRRGIFRPEFWEFNSQDVRYNPTTVPIARTASAAMHGILNVIDAFQDVEAKKEAADYFSEWFNKQLPPSIQDRLQGFLKNGGKVGDHKPALSSKPAVLKPATSQPKPAEAAVQAKASTAATPGKHKHKPVKHFRRDDSEPANYNPVRVDLSGINIGNLPLGPSKVNGVAPAVTETVQ